MGQGKTTSISSTQCFGASYWTSFHSSFPLPLPVSSDHYSISFFYNFSCYKWVRTYGILLCVWIISLKVMNSRVLNPCCCKQYNFIFNGWVVVFHCIVDHIFFIHSSSEGVFGLISYLAVVNSAAINMGVQVSFGYNYFISFRIQI